MPTDSALETKPTATAGRRGFLAAGAALGATGALTGWARRPAPQPTGPDWAALRKNLSTHKLSRPGERTYPLDHQLFDPRFDRLRPAGVAYCASPADVVTCLSFVKRFSLPFRMRSGGHSYAGWSSVTGGLVVDVSRINHFTVGNGHVVVGAGLDLITCYERLAAHGIAFPGGSCPTVGIAGLALGGGVGVLSRQLGLTSDNLTAVQLVTADGSVVTCDATSDPDLFWACRGGGGGNFGVATSFTIRTRVLTEVVLFFLSWPWSLAGRVVSGWQSWAPFAPDTLWSNLHLTGSFVAGRAPQVMVGGTFLGSASGAVSELHRLYAKIGSPPISTWMYNKSFLDAMLAEADCSSVPQCNTPPFGSLPRVPAYAKSDFFSRPLSASAIRAMVSGIGRTSGITGAGGVGALAFDAFGGAINRVKPDATAFVHRNSLFLAQYSTSWTFPGSPAGVARQHQWLRSFYATLHPHANGEAYQNYIDPDLVSWRQAYYGANYPRLAAVKAKYDPNGLFQFPQAISPS
jgi:FAD/FMN-containing dehydrogenase